MTTLAMQWMWHNQCGEGITESAVLVGIGVFLLAGLAVWAVVRWIENR